MTNGKLSCVYSADGKVFVAVPTHQLEQALAFAEKYFFQHGPFRVAKRQERTMAQAAGE